MKKLFIVAIMLLTFTLSADWSKEEQDGFMRGCISDKVGYHLCLCTMEYLQKRYPKDEDLKKITIQDMYDAVKDCTGAK